MLGRTISHYRIVEKLGEGGMGVVYKAEDLKLHRPVALKTLSEPSPQSGERLLVEAEAAAALNHPNICTVYEIDEEHQLLAMEFLDGDTVAAKVKDRPLPLDEALRIAIQAAQGLQAAHERGITHRDIKPSNIMLTSRGDAKVMDFGLARIGERTRMTRSGTLIGTPAYMSPEQAEGKRVDRRTDIWSLGVVLYEMISGQLPFRGESPAAVIHSILALQPEPLTALRSGLPVEIDRIVGKALAKNPAERYQHIDELLVDLNAIVKARSADRQIGAPSRAPRLGRPAIIGIALLVGLVALGFLLPRRAWRTILPISDRGSLAAVAVLPLDDVSGASDHEYFSDGMTDALINELGTITSLRVISRTSVMRYKGSRDPLSKIATELGVDHVLEGTVVQVADRVRVSARLIKADVDQQIWAKTYEREMRSVLALQREVAQAVASEIGVRFTPVSNAKPQIVNPKAYDAYLLGLQHWNNPPRGIAPAMDEFQRAIELDPSFAPAYAALARCYVVGGGGRFTSRWEVGRRAEELATKALALDENTADAHSVLGYLKTYFDYDWQGAARAYRRALELNPSSSDAYHRYSHYLMIVGRPEQGFDASRRAIELNPFDRTIVGHHVWTLYMARRYAEAAKYAESVLAADRENAYARNYGYRVYEQLKDYRRILDGKPPRHELARAFALSGASDQSRRMLDDMLRDTTVMNAPFSIALVYLALGDKAKTLDWLEQGYDRRVYPLPDIRVDARFDPLRAEKRFQELLRRMGLDVEPPSTWLPPSGFSN